MKKFVFTALASVALCTSPALADHHQGSSEQQNHGQANADQHAHNMQAVLKDSHIFAKRAVDLLVIGNKSIV